MGDLILERGCCAVVVIECQNDLDHESNIGARGIGRALASAVLLGTVATSDVVLAVPG